jgi:hypothetical protein
LNDAEAARALPSPSEVHTSGTPCTAPSPGGPSFPGVTLPFRGDPARLACPWGCTLPPCPSPSGWAPRSESRRALEKRVSAPRTSRRLGPPSKSLAYRKCRRCSPERTTDPPLGFGPLQRLPGGGQPPAPGFPVPARCVFRFSRPLDALLRPPPAGLISCRSRSWGSPFRALLLAAQPYAVSGAAPLLSLLPSRPRPPPRSPRGAQSSVARPVTAPRLQGLVPRGSPVPHTVV